MAKRGWNVLHNCSVFRVLKNDKTMVISAYSDIILIDLATMEVEFCSRDRVDADDAELEF